MSYATRRTTKGQCTCSIQSVLGFCGAVSAYCAPPRSFAILSSSAFPGVDICWPLSSLVYIQSVAAGERLSPPRHTAIPAHFHPILLRFPSVLGVSLVHSVTSTATPRNHSSRRLSAAHQKEKSAPGSSRGSFNILKVFAKLCKIVLLFRSLKKCHTL